MSLVDLNITLFTYLFVRKVTDRRNKVTKRHNETDIEIGGKITKEIFQDFMLLLQFLKYSEVPTIRPPMVLVESGQNSEQVSLMRTIYILVLIFIANGTLL